MPEFLLSDHIRSTPGRTIGALLFAGYRRLSVAVRSTPIRSKDDRASPEANLYRATSSKGFETSGRAA